MRIKRVCTEKKQVLAGIIFPFFVGDPAEMSMALTFIKLEAGIPAEAIENGYSLDFLIRLPEEWTIAERKEGVNKFYSKQ